MAFDDAHKGIKAKKEYRDALREARTLRVKLANKMMQDALHSSEPVPPSTVQAMESIRRSEEVEFGVAAKNGRKGNKPGVNLNVDEARKLMEGDS